MKNLLSIFAILFLFFDYSLAQLPDSIVAQIGDKQISRRFFENTLQMKQDEGFNPNSCEYLNLEIFKILLHQEAKRHKLKVDENEKKRRLELSMIYCLANKRPSDDLLEQKELRKKSNEKEIEKRMMIHSYQTKLANKVKISHREVKQYFQNQVLKLKDSLPFFQAMVEVQKIVKYSQPSDSTKIAYSKKIIENIDSLTINFPIRHFEDNVYKLVWEKLEVETFSTVFDIPKTILAKLSIGQKEIFDLNQSQFLVYKIAEKSSEKKMIEYFVANYPLQNDDKSYLELLKIKKMIENKKISFSRVFRQYADKEGFSVNKNGFLLLNNSRFLEIDQIDSYVYFTIDTMQVGQISLPTVFHSEDGKRGYQLLSLVSKTPTQTMNLNNPAHYAKIKAMALEEKQNRFIKNWFFRMCTKYRVKVADEFQGCLQKKP